MHKINFLSPSAKLPQKKTMAPQPPPTYAPLPRRRSGVPSFPVSNAHLVQPLIDSRGHRSSSKRLSRMRKSYFDEDEDDDDDEFHTASDDEDTDDDDDDVKDYDDDRDSDSLSEKSLVNDAKHMLPTARRNGFQPKLHGATGSQRNSSTVDRTSHRSSTNRHSVVEMRPQTRTKSRETSGPHLVIDIPEYSAVTRKNATNPLNESENETPNDGKPRSPVSSPGFNGQQGISNRIRL